MTVKMYDCASCLAKYLLCGFNFIIFLAGSAVLVVGIWLVADPNSFIGISKIIPSDELHNFIQPKVIEQVSYAILAIGILIFLVSFLGYCGALKESQCMLTTYGILLIVILVLEIAAGILAVVYKSKVETETKDVLITSLSHYKPTTEETDAVTQAWDQLQMNLHCCGVNNYSDYAGNQDLRNASRLVPESCCILKEDKTPVSDTCTTSPNDSNSYFNKGCYSSVVSLLRNNLEIVIGIAAGLAIIEILGIFLSFCLAKNITDYEHR
ncbi:unnamed protein product [Acanthoscelides obtectus]|uniref:Tetraspanin n=2 Tax=Acanthoscelides obtectus TaxID=200917 RepID=A0A9P0MCJ9_ACAOB|nr:unnamed protein product [Acanthoscelides obtectus]CAK1621492.1 CD82 antigen [Acanthoscelides obtectus]